MHGDFLQPLISAERIESRIEELGRNISADYPAGKNMPELRLIGILKGSFIFLADLIRQISRDVSVDFLGVSSYGLSTKSSGKIKIQQDLTHKIEGVDVVLVEDIIDTGTTLSYVCNILKQRNPHSLRIATLLDKPSRRVVKISPSYVGFEIPDKFVVGYGLDHSQYFRNRSDICVLTEK
ncbi:MAG: hypoxanthine phosphoribosyltransferase [Solibacterales bacterium]|nr:hypoxanthine phosphoribosyltransferase [Bryobacterales bacterium]